MSYKELLEHRKAPTSKKNYVGIEIEFLLPKTKTKRLNELLIQNNLQWNVNVGSDGSVRDLDFVPIFGERQSPWDRNLMIPYTVNEAQKKLGYEIRILAQQSEAPEIISKVCGIIKSCKGLVNSTCGLHVHLDMRNRNYDMVYNNLYQVQPLMFTTQPVSRHKNEFCKRMSRKYKAPDSRYYAINSRAYEEHRTIEVRLHEATIDAKEILMWTGFLIKIASHKEMIKGKIETVEQLPWLPDNVKGYLNERISKYSSKQNNQTA